jgi:hypothetical protein
MDPYRVLGVSRDVSEEEAAEAYRTLAKRLHPDVNPGDGERMREVNAAYADLRRRGFPRPRFKPAPAPPPGNWLPPEVRSRLGRELVGALHPQEPVLLVADASTWDAHAVRLVVTDRRLLWLRDDAPVDRVRRLPFVAIDRVEARMARNRRRGELRVFGKDRRRHGFAEMRAELLEDALWLIRPRLRPMRPAPA